MRLMQYYLHLLIKKPTINKLISPIPFFAKVIKKLIQQYMDLFLVLKSSGHFAYRLNSPKNWKIYLIYSISHQKPAQILVGDLLHQIRLYQPPFIFVEDDINILRLFEIHHSLNTQIIKKVKSQAIEYFIRLTGY